MPVGERSKSLGRIDPIEIAEHVVEGLGGREGGGRESVRGGSALDVEGEGGEEGLSRGTGEVV